MEQEVYAFFFFSKEKHQPFKELIDLPLRDSNSGNLVRDPRFRICPIVRFANYCSKVAKLKVT